MEEIHVYSRYILIAIFSIGLAFILSTAAYACWADDGCDFGGGETTPDNGGGGSTDNGGGGTADNGGPTVTVEHSEHTTTITEMASTATADVKINDIKITILYSDPVSGVETKIVDHTTAIIDNSNPFNEPKISTRDLQGTVTDSDGKTIFSNHLTQTPISSITTTCDSGSCSSTTQACDAISGACNTCNGDSCCTDSSCITCGDNGQCSATVGQPPGGPVGQPPGGPVGQPPGGKISGPGSTTPVVVTCVPDRSVQCNACGTGTSVDDNNCGPNMPIHNDYDDCGSCQWCSPGLGACPLQGCTINGQSVPNGGSLPYCTGGYLGCKQGWAQQETDTCNNGQTIRGTPTCTSACIPAACVF